MLDVSREEITEGSLSRALVLLAAPLVAQNLFQVAQQVIDTFWVGRMEAGEAAVAAIGVNFPVLSTVFAITTVTPAIGTQVLASQRYGGEDLTGARRIAVHGLVLGLTLGVVVGVAALLFARPALSVLNPGDEVLPLAATYLATLAVAFPVMSMSDVLEYGFIAWGDSRAALYINVTAVVVNVALDPFLIFGWGPFPALGIRGAALASVTGYTGGFLLALGMSLGLRSTFTLTREAVSLRVAEFAELVDVGGPISVQNLGRDAVRLVIIGIVGTAGGAAALSAYTIGARVASVAFIPAQGLQQAAQSVVGQNLGAEHPDRARRTTWIGVALAVGALTVVGLIQALFPEGLARLFVPDITAEGLALTADYLVILALGYWAIGAMYLFSAGFNGASRTRITMVANLLKYWAVRLPVAAVAAFLLGWGPYGPFWAVTISNVVAALGAGAYYYYSSNRGMFERAAEEVGEATPGD